MPLISLAKNPHKLSDDEPINNSVYYEKNFLTDKGKPKPQSLTGIILTPEKRQKISTVFLLEISKDRYIEKAKEGSICNFGELGKK